MFRQSSGVIIVLDEFNPSFIYLLQIPDNYNGYNCYKDGGKNDMIFYNIGCCFFIDFED